MRMHEAARLMAAETATAERNLPDDEITGFGIDSRLIEPGNLFFALSPEDYTRHSFTGASFVDAHAFIPQALGHGAAAAVARRERVQRDKAFEGPRDRLVLVDDVIEALQRLAHETLRAWGGPVVAITGSAGKTTTKDLTAHLLGAAGRRVLKSQKNFNNELGVPLSILQMETAGHRPSDYDVAVLEMGMSMAGEITRLTRIAPPDIAVELCVAPVHLEFFESIDGIAAAKAELVENLKPDGTAILNFDDERVRRMRGKHQGRTLGFGVEQEADVMATELNSSASGATRFRLRTSTLR